MNVVNVQSGSGNLLELKWKCTKVEVEPLVRVEMEVALTVEQATVYTRACTRILLS